MRKILHATLALFLAINVFAQSNLQDVAHTTLNENWWAINDNEQVLTRTFFEEYGNSLIGDSESTFVLIKEEEDDLGMMHSRYAQYQNGILVEGAQVILHSKNGFVKKLNGNLVKSIRASTVPSITFNQALKNAKAHLNNAALYYEIPAMEAWIKEFKNDANATFYPKNELVFVHPSFSQNGENYVLAYKLDLYYDALENHTTLYFDANSGDLVFEAAGCHTGSTTGVAHTKYHGIQSIITDSVNASKYVLVDNTRGGGVETYNLAQDSIYANAQLFEDADNTWNNFNTQLDEVGADVHWATEMAYDYFLNTHNRNSYDNLGAKLISYVHFKSNYFNAFWNGMYLTYGDGNGFPLTSIDVVGHELAHGVTGNSAALIYSYESGALNESFSDIFGTDLEFNAFADSASWIVGMHNFQLRNMANPNQYNQPDTYLGTMWYTGTQDNGGVHINSGVQNFWYYLLSNGGSGTNDFGTNYTVDSIGMAKAAAISYRNLVYYLTPSSQYYDARQGAIEAAEDLYGNCSFEVNQVIKAWHAVGVGPDVPSIDLDFSQFISPLTSCDLTAQEDVTIQFIFHESGCNDSILAVGDSVEVSYKINSGTPVVEYFIPTSTVFNGDTITYTFSQKADLSQPGNYFFSVLVSNSKDLITSNNVSNNYRVVKTDYISTNDSITFENSRTVHESKLYSLTARQHSKADINFTAKATGFRGLHFTGKNPSPDIDTAFSEADNFILNPEYQSDFCSCIDARNWDYVTLSFDLKQTFSSFYQPIGSTSPAQFASSLRVVVDGQQVGGQFHPTTTVLDTFMRQFVVLDAFAGTEFNLCLEGKHFFDAPSDPTSSVGDNSYIDNINIEDVEFISIAELEPQDVKVLPNPSEGVFEVEINSFVNAELNINVVDQLGRTVFSLSDEAVRGFTTVPVDMTGFAAGIYFVHVRINASTIVKKVVLR